MPTAFVFINTEPAWMVEVLKNVSAVEGVVEATMVYGLYDLVVRIEVDTMDKLKRIITERIRKIHKVKATITAIVVKI